MNKTDELKDPSSCMNKAAPDEMTFVLLARDSAAPAAIRAWCAKRIRQKKNLRNDPQIIEAYSAAVEMERQYTARKGNWPKGP